MSRSSTKSIKTIVAILGMAHMLTASILITVTFLTAYASPGKSVLVRINSIGEANIELLIIVVCMSCVPYTFYRFIRWLRLEDVEKFY